MLATSIYIFAVLAIGLVGCEVTAQRCGIIDLGFILDTSGSLRNEFDKEKKFIKEIAKRFDISPAGSHVGVVRFSHYAELSIKFSDCYDQKSFENALDDIRLINRTTRIDLALRVANDQLFKKVNGARSFAPKTLVLLTDGTQTYGTNDAVDPCTISDKMRAAGINIIVVGVGSQTDVKELSDLAGGPGKWYRAKNFDELLETGMIDQVSKSSCPPPPKCTSVADIGFVIDTSGSLREDFKKEKHFLKRAVSSFGISRDGIHAGVVSFAYFAKLNITFADYDDVVSFNAAVDEIPFDGGATRIDTALKKADTELFAVENGARLQAAKYLILITDGSQTPTRDSISPGIYTDDMRMRGYTIIVLGIGPATDPVELDYMAGGISKSFRARSFDQLLKGDYVAKVKEQLATCA